jgi:hypothetical protein
MNRRSFLLSATGERHLDSLDPGQFGYRITSCEVPA